MEHQEFKSEHFFDEHGNPTGGHSSATGVCIAWQHGPLGKGDDRKAPNGALIGTVLDMVIDRLNFFQASEFASDYNAEAIEHITRAIDALDRRTKDRQERGVEGTNVQ